MDKNYLIGLLKAYSPELQNPEEQIFKSRMLDFIEQHDNCFERSLDIGHITASAWLINKDNSKALLTHHAKLDRWFQLGGHCDGNPDVLAVAIKEAQEESGIIGIVPVINQIFDIDVHTIPANKKEKEHDHFDVRFLLKVISNEDIIPSSESKDLKWISKDLNDLTTDNPSVVRMFKKWLAIKVF